MNKSQTQKATYEMIPLRNLFIWLCWVLGFSLVGAPLYLGCMDFWWWFLLLQSTGPPADMLQ